MYWLSPGLFLSLFLLSSSLLAQGQRSSVEPSVQEPVTQADVDQALDHGAQWLLEQIDPQQTGGVGNQAGTSALAVYAALKAGARHDAPEIEAWLGQLNPDRYLRTYDTACLILALATQSPERHLALIYDLSSRLVQWQNRSGDWGYPGGADLSNTQYAALGIWKASQLGLRVEPEVWSQLADGVLLYSDPRGGFGYNPGGGSRATMNAAGVGTLAICEAQLRLAGQWQKNPGRKISKVRDQGLLHLIENFDQAMRGGGWHYYYLYGLERLAAWSGLSRIGLHDWYQEGVDVLVPAQLEDGSWQHSAVETSFALLFLARATAQSAPGTAFTQSREQPLFDLEAPGYCWLEADGLGPVQLAVAKWRWAKLRPFEWPDDRGRGPRVAWVEYLVDGEAVAVALADKTSAMSNNRFRVLQHFSNQGAVEVTARFHLKLPPRAKGLPEFIDSAPLDVVVARCLKVQDAQDGSDGSSVRQNLLQAKGVSTATSSTIGVRPMLPPGSHQARAAIDRNRATAWIFSDQDQVRKLALRLPQERLASYLRVVPATARAKAKGQLSQPGLIEVILNGKRRFPLLMPTTPGEAAVLEFPQEISVKRLEIRILTLRPGDSPYGGIAEVQLMSGARVH
jgi:hypothetical protein